MCFVCIMIDKSIPSPKTLINANKEYNIPEKHLEEIAEKVLNKLNKEDRDKYEQELINESYMDFLRNT